MVPITCLHNGFTPGGNRVQVIAIENVQANLLGATCLMGMPENDPSQFSNYLIVAAALLLAVMWSYTRSSTYVVLL